MMARQAKTARQQDSKTARQQDSKTGETGEDCWQNRRSHSWAKRAKTQAWRMGTIYARLYRLGDSFRTTVREIGWDEGRADVWYLVVMYTDEYLIGHGRRGRMRLPGCDYSREGPYFVTICTDGKKCTLGVVTGDVVTLMDVGVAVREAWVGLPGRFSTLVLDEFIVMPNHLHGLVGFVGAGFTPPDVGREKEQNRRPSVSDVICAFKSLSTRMARLKGHPGVLWQRGYYEHIVRDGEDLRNCQRYILENPLRWGVKQGSPEGLGGVTERG